MLAAAAGKDDQAVLVSLEALYVGGQRFDREVGTTRVDGDADGWCVFARNAGFLGER